MIWLETRFPPPLVALVAGMLMWCLNRWAPVSAWLHPPWTRLGTLPAAVALALFVAAAGRFRREGTTIDPVTPDKASVLVTGGIFRHTRNPMYVALSLLLCGMAIWFGSCSPWLIVVAYVAFLTRFQILPEERVLSAKFGATYTGYQRAVPRWLWI